MDHIEEQISSRIEEIHSTFQKFLSKGPSSSGPNPQVKGVDSSNPMHFHSNHDPNFPRVDVKNIDGSDPTT